VHDRPLLAGLVDQGAVVGAGDDTGVIVLDDQHVGTLREDRAQLARAARRMRGAGRILRARGDQECLAGRQRAFQFGGKKAFVIDRYSKKGGGRLRDMPSPELRDTDVLVEIHAAGINLLDSKVRTGEFKLILPYGLPLILGHDVAGVVVRVGSKVRQFKPGDEVYARPRDGQIGAFAEFIAMNEADVALKPKTLTMEEAASIPLVGLTAWQALIEKANLRKGQKVLVHAGSGGVGTFAIQLARHLGAMVATTTSTANVELVKGLGADVVVDYKKQAFETVLRDYDVVLNSLGKDTLEKSLFGNQNS